MSDRNRNLDLKDDAKTLAHLFQGENEIEFQIEKHQILNEIRVNAQDETWLPH